MKTDRKALAERLEKIAQDRRASAEHSRSYADWLESEDSEGQKRFGTVADSRADAEMYAEEAEFYRAAASALREEPSPKPLVDTLREIRDRGVSTLRNPNGAAADEYAIRDMCRRLDALIEAEDGWNRECVVCGHKWVQEADEVECPRCEALREEGEPGLYGWKLWEDGLEVTDARSGHAYQRAVIEVDENDPDRILVYDRELLAELCTRANRHPHTEEPEDE